VTCSTSSLATSARGVLDCAVTGGTPGTDVNGPCIRGTPGARISHLSRGVVDEDSAFTMLRQAKVMLDGVPRKVLAGAVAQGNLVG
jgi:hypothetical protein